MEEIIVSRVGGLRQMEAPEGYYLTQADETEENRVYVRKRIILSEEDASAWRLADEAENEAWEATQQELEWMRMNEMNE